MATSYVYQGEDIYAESGVTYTVPTALYTHGPGTDDPLLRLTGTLGPNATASYYHQDGLGSVVGLSNATGGTIASARYDAWGNKTATVGTLPQYGYTGREPDATGLVYYRARYYDPSQRRFTQRDPIGMAGGVNLYAYVEDNPVNFTDPEGTLSFPLHYGITFTASLNAGYGFIDSANLAWNATAVDFRSGSQGVMPAQTQQHMMGARYTDASGIVRVPSSQQAISSGQKFIAGQVTAAAGSSNFLAGGNAAHGIQDKYSPSHKGTLWEGFKKLGVVGTIEHVFEDTFPGIANIKGAYHETSSMLEAVRTGAPQTYLNSNYNAAATSGQQSLKQMANPAPPPAYSGGGSIKRSK